MTTLLIAMVTLYLGFHAAQDGRRVRRTARTPRSPTAPASWASSRRTPGGRCGAPLRSAVIVYGVAIGAWWLVIIGVGARRARAVRLGLRVLPRRARALSRARPESATPVDASRRRALDGLRASARFHVRAGVAGVHWRCLHSYLRGVRCPSCAPAASMAGRRRCSACRSAAAGCGAARRPATPPAAWTAGPAQSPRPRRPAPAEPAAAGHDQRRRGATGVPVDHRSSR